MKKSVIESSHHFYVTFFNDSKLKSYRDVVAIFSSDIETEQFKNGKEIFIHAQILLERRYGSENALIGNQEQIKGKLFYRYDLYIGKIDIDDKRVFFIAYPYFKLRDFLNKLFVEKQIQPKYYKLDLNLVMDYMKGKERTFANDTVLGWKAEIIKYTAGIKDSREASKINLSGENPLNSRAFEILNNDDELVVTTNSLKLRCIKDGVGTLELSFDKLSNYRFWIKNSGEMQTVPVVPYAFAFFNNVNALLESSSIANLTMLEDE